MEYVAAVLNLMAPDFYQSIFNPAADHLDFVVDIVGLLAQKTPKLRQGFL